MGSPVDEVIRFGSYNKFAGMISLELRYPNENNWQHFRGVSITPLSRSPQPVMAALPKLYASVGGQGSVELTMACEREEAKAVVLEFLRGRGVSAQLAARSVNKASPFITHLLAILQSRHHTRYITGRELTTTEIRSTLLPYLESFGEIHNAGIVDIFVSFPDPPPPRTELIGLHEIDEDLDTLLTLTDINIADCPQLHAHKVDGKLRPSLVYFLKLGFPPEQVERLVSRFPTILRYSVTEKIEPVVDLLLGMGVPLHEIPRILLKRPQLFGCSVEENLKPSVVFLEKLGVERHRWGKILVSFPHMLTYSETKLQQIVGFLSEMGLSPSEIGKVLTKFPHVVGYSVEAKLRPLASYFHGIGILDLRVVIVRSPQTLGLSLELNIKPTIQFFLELGFTDDEFSKLVTRFPQVLGLHVENNIRPKWDYFREMNRSILELVEFPQYFGYSLEHRIQPRHMVLLSYRIVWSLNRMLSSTDISFNRQLEKDSKLLTLEGGQIAKHCQGVSSAREHPEQFVSPK